jgi:hypothetical protein
VNADEAHARRVIRYLAAADLPPVSWSLTHTPVNRRPFPFGVAEVDDLAQAADVAHAYAAAFGAVMPPLTECASTPDDAEVPGLDAEPHPDTRRHYAYLVVGGVRGVLVMVAVVIVPGAVTP